MPPVGFKPTILAGDYVYIYIYNIYIYNIYINFSDTKCTKFLSTVSVYEFLMIFRMYSKVTIFLISIKRLVFVVENCGVF